MPKEETLSKFLDINYVKTRVNELPEVQRGDVKVDVYKSANPKSKSIYVIVYCIGRKSEWYKCYTLRISDHEFGECNFKQFIINPDKKMTKRHREQFTSLLKRAVKYAIERGIEKKLLYLYDSGDETTTSF